MSEVEKLLREDLRGRTPYGAPQLDVAVRLNTNENPYPPSPELVEDLAAAVAEVAAAMNRYPDRDAVLLRSELAAYLARTTGVPLGTEQVWAANGSNEVLQQLLQAFGGPGRTALGFVPTYSMHQLICQGTGTQWLPMERLAGFALEPEQAALVVREHSPDVVFLCSPNNPTGTALDLDVVAAVYDAARGLVVVDEAYGEFSTRPSAVTLLEERPRLVVTRTMSKAFAFAAARLGYLAAAPEVVEALQLVRLPYHLSVLTQAAARAALAHADELLATVEAVKAQRDRLVREIRGMGLEVVESDANFVLFGEFGDQRSTWQGLLDRGVLVRDVGVPGWLRVTAGTEPETSAFLDALRAGLATVGESSEAVGDGEVDA
ncbi:MAG TPA: histidinol-phosphate transaminase [Actinomycetes bacterium]|nr:histidinol-phosphate transaminase [Actinomycetes bacterium]